MTDHEPMPITNLNSTPVQASAISRFIGVYHAQWARGKEKYGTDLMTFNGRDASNDALQELADLLAYIVQLSMERTALEAENAALRQDAAVGRAVHEAIEQVGQVVFIKHQLIGGDKVRLEVALFAPHEEGNWREYYGDTLPAALVAAGLMEEEK